MERVHRAIPTPLPGVDTDRIAVRIAEAMAVGREPSKLREFPEWTQRIMLILNRQFVPKEFESILSAVSLPRFGGQKHPLPE